MKYSSLKGLYYKDKDLWNETYNKRVNSESTYKFNIGFGDDFFVIITESILNKITTILKLDKKLNSIGMLVPPIAKSDYTKMCIIDEIKGTNDIEGVKSSRAEIGEILNNIDKTKNKRLHGLIQKYSKLMNGEDENINTIEDIRKIYDELVLKEVVEENPDHMPDGIVFRKDIVKVENSIGKVIHKGLPTEEQVIMAMNNVIQIMNNDDINEFIKISVIHYLIGYIHPFYDGNGRLIRYITSKQLANELESIIGFKIAYIIKRNLASYLKMFSETNLEYNRRDLTLFTDKFFDFIIEALEETIEAMEEAYYKFSHYDDLLEKLKFEKKEYTIYNILLQNILFDTEALDVGVIKEICGFSDTFIRKTLSIGVESGYINKDKLGKKMIYNLNLEKFDTE